MSDGYSILRNPEFERARFNAAHAWALELNEMEPDVRRLVFVMSKDVETRFRNELLYGVDLRDAHGRPIDASYLRRELSEGGMDGGLARPGIHRPTSRGR